MTLPITILSIGLTGCLAPLIFCTTTVTNFLVFDLQIYSSFTALHTERLLISIFSLYTIISSYRSYDSGSAFHRLRNGFHFPRIVAFSSGSAYSSCLIVVTERTCLLIIIIIITVLLRHRVATFYCFCYSQRGLTNDFIDGAFLPSSPTYYFDSFHYIAFYIYSIPQTLHSFTVFYL